MTDPDIQAAIDRAAERLGRRLAAVAAVADPVAAARAFIVEDLIETSDRWTPRPEPPPRKKPGTGDPPTEEFREELDRIHRRALNTREDTP